MTEQVSTEKVAAEKTAFVDLAGDCDYLEKTTMGYKWSKKAYEGKFTTYGTEFSGNVKSDFEFKDKIVNEFGAREVYCKPFYRIFDKETHKPCETLDLVYTYRTFLFEDGIVNTYLNYDQNQLLVDVFSTNKEKFEELCKFFMGAYVFRVEEEKIPVYALQSTREGLQLLEFGGIDKELVRENYTEELLKDFDLIAKDIKNDAPTGRLSILTGDPGTGKTWFVRGLIKECPESKFVVVPPEMIRSLTGPDVITLFVNEKSKDDGPIVLVVEDGDLCIAKRDGADVGLVSALLNMGDGILGQLLDLRIIVTSNLGHADLDPAVTRPGRLNRFAEFKKLDVEHAAKIYERETKEKKEFDKPMTLAEIYNVANEKVAVSYSPPVKGKKKIGFGL